MRFLNALCIISIPFQEKVIIISDYFLFACSNPKKFIITENITSVGNQRTNLSSIEITEKLESTGSYAFSECSLYNINFISRKSGNYIKFCFYICIISNFVFKDIYRLVLNIVWNIVGIVNNLK